MKKVKRWRYYCEYCKKSGGSGFHMKVHEKGCTKNPNRECGFCKIAGLKNDTDAIKHLIDQAIKKINSQFGEFWEYDPSHKDDINNELIKELLVVAKGCPACILAAIRQHEEHYLIDFDYKKAKEEFWDEHTQRPDPDDYM